MSRNRFDEIKSILHVPDNSFLEKGSQMTKMKALYDLPNTKVVQFGIVHGSLSVDESMVPYFGHHSCKHFIKAKPICFGFKFWVLASSTGMLYHLHIYERKPIELKKRKPHLDHESQKGFLQYAIIPRIIVCFLTISSAATSHWCNWVKWVFGQLKPCKMIELRTVP